MSELGNSHCWIIPLADDVLAAADVIGLTDGGMADRALVGDT